MSDQRIETLTALRGIAAMAVVLLHCLSAVPGFDGTRFVAPSGAVEAIVNLLSFTPLALLWAGGQAVAVFFVLSGFVLALPFAAGTQLGYGPFVLRRTCRIYLPYLAAVALALALRSLVSVVPLADASAWMQSSWSAPLTFYSLVDHLFMLGADRANTLDPPVWSLVIEMRVSLLFPLLVVLVSRVGMLRSIVATYGAYVVFRILFKRAGLAEDGTLFSAGETIGYAPLFLLGIGLALNLDRARSFVAARSTRELLLIAGAGALLLWIDPGIMKRHVRDLLMGPGAALLILACLDPRGISTFLRLRLLNWLGRISYSLYLVHFPLLVAAVYALHGVVRVGTVALLLPLVAVAAAALFHSLVERPATELGRRLTSGACNASIAEAMRVFLHRR